MAQNASTRRQLLALAGFSAAGAVPPITIRINVLFDRGAHGGKGLNDAERALFHRHQQRARQEFAASAILFDLKICEGAFLRKQGYSEIHPTFLVRGCINLFVTDTLGYDVDRNRTGGSSIGPHAHSSKYPANPFYKTYLGLREAGGTTLPHEYAHHFTLDTTRNPAAAANLWADLRNDYYLWRQRHGTLIAEFRACANSEFAVARPNESAR